MDTLPNEIILLIFDKILKITDKRQFLKTCNKYNKLTKYAFTKYENDYRVMDFIENYKSYSVEKFTLELCHDKYFDMIPNSYITPINKIIVKALVIFNCLPKLKIAKENGCKFDLICYYSSIFGHLDILKWARENNYYWDSLICSNAAFNGHFEFLKWARENGCNWTTNTCSYAARNGHLEILKWARENGCNWNVETCFYAARQGHLEILKWARENGCDWDKKTCILAACNGHLDILKWARENGCDWDSNVCHIASQNGHLELLKWAIDNGCPQF